MSNQPFSIFNDIIGPVMTGPSSSHTAAPSRIGYMTRHMLAGELKEITFEFDRNGSFAASYDTQGTDRGLVGGMMGYTPDDPRMITALTDAEAKGIEVKFIITDFDAPHPNTVRITAKGTNDEIVTSTGISTGGGIMEVLNVNGFDVSMLGKFYELLLTLPQTDYSDELLNNLKNVLEGYEYIDVIENNGEVLFDIKFSHPIEDATIEEIKAVYDDIPIRIIPPVFPVLSRKDCEVPFRTAAEMEEFAEKNDYAPWEVGLHYEAARGNISIDEAMNNMIHIVDVMEGSINKALNSPRPGKIIQARAGQYMKMSKEGKLIETGAMDIAVAWTMAMVEVNSYYGTIVAAPTSGACGTVPGAVLGVSEYLGKTKEEKAKALFASGAVGLIIAEEATFAAELCGCQAECGSASAMAAAGIVQLMDGNVKESNAAASISLQNVLGMICDSVANLVEVPCLGRNVLGAVNAISSANMVMAGVEDVIPLDEVIISMLEVGELMPPELCCTNSGGLAVTKTSMKLAEKINNARETK